MVCTNEKIKKFIAANYLFSDEKVYSLTKPKTTKIGEIFEILFKTLIENEGLKEGKDFLDLRYLKHRCIGIPDFYFTKTNTFIEIKSDSTNYKVTFNENQIKKIKELKNKDLK